MLVYFRNELSVIAIGSLALSGIVCYDPARTTLHLYMPMLAGFTIFMLITMIMGIAFSISNVSLIARGVGSPHAGHS